MYSPKIRVILPLFACHSNQVILEWLTVLLTVNLIKTLNLSKLKRRLVMWGPAYRFELRINSVAVWPLNSTWYWGLAAYEGLVFSGLYFLWTLFGFIFCAVLIYGWKLVRAMSPWSLWLIFESIWSFDNSAWLWTLSRQCVDYILGVLHSVLGCYPCSIWRCKTVVWINCIGRCALSLWAVTLTACGMVSR